MLEVDIQRTLGAFSLSLTFEHRQGILILFGRSGAGKTTALRLIAGMDAPTDGTIRFERRLLYSRAQRVNVPIQDRRIGFIFQHHNLFPHMTAYQNLRYAAADPAEIDRWTHTFHVEHVLDRHPSRLSGGEQQRIALIRALVTQPKLLLMDEPLSAVDLATRDTLLNELKLIPRASGIPIIYVTHSVNEAYRLGDRVIVLENGRIIHDGVPIDVFHTPTSVPLAGLSGTENLITGDVVRHHPGDSVTDLRIGDTLLHVPLCRQRAGGRAVVAIRPEDILIALHETRDTSARNQFCGHIVDVRHDAFPTILVEVPGGPTLRARITAGSLKALRLKPGLRVYLLIKTWACHPVDEDRPDE